MGGSSVPFEPEGRAGDAPLEPQEREIEEQNVQKREALQIASAFDQTHSAAIAPLLGPHRPAEPQRRSPPKTETECTPKTQRQSLRRQSPRRRPRPQQSPRTQRPQRPQ